MEREARTDRQTDSLQKFLMGKVLPTPRSDDDGMSSISKLTPSKRCLENRVDSPAKRRKNFSNLMKFWGGGQENKNIPVTFRPTEFSVSDQLVDLEGGSAEMESDNLLHKD